MKYNYDVLREATASLRSIIESKFDEVNCLQLTEISL